MFTIMYKLGNGYRCCCQQTWTEEEFYDTKEEAISDLTKIACDAEDWLGITHIIGYDGDSDEFEKELDIAIEKEMLARKNADAIADLQREQKQQMNGLKISKV